MEYDEISKVKFQKILNDHKVWLDNSIVYTNKKMNVESGSIYQHELRNSRLEKAIMIFFLIDHVNLSGSDCTKANFSESTFYESNFNEVNFCGSNLTGVKIINSYFKNAKFDKDTIFEFATLDLDTFINSKWDINFLKKLHFLGVKISNECKNLLITKTSLESKDLQLETDNELSDKDVEKLIKGEWGL